MAWFGWRRCCVLHCTSDVVRWVGDGTADVACVSAVCSCILFSGETYADRVFVWQHPCQTDHGKKPTHRFTFCPQNSIFNLTVCSRFAGKTFCTLPTGTEFRARFAFACVGVCVCARFFPSRLAPATVPCRAILYVFMDCDSKSVPITANSFGSLSG